MAYLQAHREAGAGTCADEELPVLQVSHRRRGYTLPELHEPALRSRAFRAAFVLAAFVACTGAASDTVPQYNQHQNTPQIGGRIECRITRIADGDTVYCGSAGRIRLLLIDAPELSQYPQGRDAKRVLQDILPLGTMVDVETDVRVRDQYDRILGYVFLRDGKMINEEMARSGYVTALVYPPNVKYVERIRNAVIEARKAKRGLWATDFFECSPRDYRAGRCGTPRPRNSGSFFRQPSPRS